MKIFIDTNIFLDLLLKREFSYEAKLILNAVFQKIFDGYVLDMTLLNIDYIAKKQIKDIRDFLVMINSNFEVIGADNKLFFKAFESEGKDLEDIVQFYSAKEFKCDVIVTNDKDFYQGDIETLSSIEFIKKYL